MSLLIITEVVISIIEDDQNAKNIKLLTTCSRTYKNASVGESTGEREQEEVCPSNMPCVLFV